MDVWSKTVKRYRYIKRQIKIEELREREEFLAGDPSCDIEPYHRNATGPELFCALKDHGEVGLPPKIYQRLMNYLRSY